MQAFQFASRTCMSRGEFEYFGPWKLKPWVPGLSLKLTSKQYVIGLHCLASEMCDRKRGQGQHVFCSRLTKSVRMGPISPYLEPKILKWTFLGRKKLFFVYTFTDGYMYGDPR